MNIEMPETDRISILLLGDPGLRVKCTPVDAFASSEFRTNGDRLIRALEQFRAEFGFGRAISAPQIGIPLRMIAMNLGEGPFLLVNPEIAWRSENKFTLWDDCMSFPWLMVRLERHERIDLLFYDSEGNAREWHKADRAVSELVQHEVDHLDGILAVDRAVDRNSVIARSLYQEQKEFFDRQVDYFIVPTIAAR